jgi:hypothetical protein
MGILNKLMFWKRDRDEDLGEEGGEGREPDFGQGPSEGGEGLRTEVPPWSENHEERGRLEMGGEWQQPQLQQPQQSSGGNEIVLARLDVINAKLDSLNQRMANLERYASEEEKKSTW